MLLRYLRQTEWSEVTRAVLEALEPLSIFGAQLLYVAQPTLSLFMERERITAWAEFLEEPEQLATLSKPLEDKNDE